MLWFHMLLDGIFHGWDLIKKASTQYNTGHFSNFSVPQFVKDAIVYFGKLFSPVDEHIRYENTARFSVHCGNKAYKLTDE